MDYHSYTPYVRVSLYTRVTDSPRTIPGYPLLYPPLFPYVRVSPYTRVADSPRTIHGYTHCYTPPPMSEYPRTLPPPPYVRVSPYTDVTLTVPGPSMDTHFSTNPLPYVRVSPYTRVTDSPCTSWIYPLLYLPPPMSEYPRTLTLL